MQFCVVSLQLSKALTAEDTEVTEMINNPFHPLHHCYLTPEHGFNRDKRDTGDRKSWYRGNHAFGVTSGYRSVGERAQTTAQGYDGQALDLGLWTLGYLYPHPFHPLHPCKKCLFYRFAFAQGRVERIRLMISVVEVPS